MRTVEKYQSTLSASFFIVAYSRARIFFPFASARSHAEGEPTTTRQPADKNKTLGDTRAGLARIYACKQVHVARSSRDAVKRGANSIEATVFGICSEQRRFPHSGKVHARGELHRR